MRHPLCAIALLALVGCAAAPPEENAEARAESIEEILTQPMNDEEYVEAQRCLATHAYRTVRVLDDRHVLFEGSGDRAWLNQLRNRCGGLRRNATLRFQLRDNRVCSLDSFEAVDTFFGRWDRASATCTLGEFQPVTPEQVEAIRAALAE